jgi:dephospho-CoA kinase
MIKVGITGSIASGKTTASKLISKKRGLLFSADKVVQRLYKKKSFRKIVAEKINLKKKFRFKSEIKKMIFKEPKTLRKLEKIIHPFVRKEMFIFIKKFKNKKFLFFEIPLLVESNLVKYFDIIIFIKSRKKIRMKRFQSKKGNKKLFKLLDENQIKDTKKMRFCDYIIVNNKSLSVLKKNLSNIIKLYE